MAKKQTGLTLVELMVTLAVAIILIAVGLPLFSGVADNNRATAQVNALSAALQLARSEAVKQGQRVTIRRSGGAWNLGWQVFLDTNADGAFNGDDQMLREWGPFSSGSSPTIDADGADFVGFVATGERVPNTTEVQFEFPDQVGSRRCIRVSLAGGVSVERERDPADWACIP